MAQLPLPDPLPFKFPRYCGLPFHGLVRNGVLTKINGSTIQYLSVAGKGGEAIVAAGPNAALPTRTPAQIAADEAAGKAWKNYALLSGKLRNIGGQDLGENAWLYCDGTATWKLRARVSRPTYDNITIRVYLSDLFGRFAGDGIEFGAETSLGSIAFVPQKIDYSGTSGTGTAVDFYESIDVDMSLFVWPKRDGSEALIWVGYSGVDTDIGLNTVPMGNHATSDIFVNNAAFDTDWLTGFSLDAFKTEPMYCKLAGILKVTVSGTGSLVAGSVGSGIAVTLENYKRMADLMTVTWPPGETAFGFDTDRIDTVQTVMVQNFLYGYQPDGDELHATYTYTDVWEPIDDPEGYPGEYAYLLETISHSVSFAGNTVTYQHQAYRRQDSINPPVGWVGSDDVAYPHIVVDTAFGNRTVLLVEECFPVFDPSSTIHTHYLTIDGSHFQYSTSAAAVSDEPAGIPKPSLAKDHGQVTYEPVAEDFAVAGEWPASCCYV